jgi:hypothetical protein
MAPSAWMCAPPSTFVNVQDLHARRQQDSSLEAIITT